jgi:hypothetical protein
MGQSVSQDLKSLVDQVKKAQKEIQQSFAESAKAAAAVFEEQAKAHKGSATTGQSMQDRVEQRRREHERQHKADLQQQQAWENEQAKRSAELNKQASRDQMAEAKRASDAIKNGIKEREKAHREAAAAQVAAERQVSQAMQRSMEMTRGLALMLSVGQKDSEKLIRTLVAVEGAHGMLARSGLGSKLAGALGTGGTTALAGLAAPAAAVVGGTAAGYYLGTLGPRLEESRTKERLGIFSGTTEAGRGQTQASEAAASRIAELEYAKESNQRRLEQDYAERQAEHSQRWQTARQPILSKMTWRWSGAIAPYREKREPGAAGYNAVEAAIAGDWAKGQPGLQAMRGEETRAAAEVARRKTEVAEATRKAEAARNAANLGVSHSAAAQQRVAEYGHWLPNANEGWWAGYKRVVGSGHDLLMTGGQHGIKLEQQAREAAMGAGSLTKGSGEAEANLQKAEKAQEDAQRRLQDAAQKRGAEEQRQYQRQIQYAEEYLGKLKEMREAHLSNAAALQQAGNSMAGQLATDPAMRAKLSAALKAEASGTATDRQIAFLAQHSSAEKAKERLDALRQRHPEREGILSGLGIGTEAVEDQKAKAAEEEKRIAATETKIQGIKDAAAQAADSMSVRLADLLRELFTSQSDRFDRELTKLREQIEQKGIGEGVQAG